MKSAYRGPAETGTGVELEVLAVDADGPAEMKCEGDAAVAAVLVVVAAAVVVLTTGLASPDVVFAVAFDAIILLAIS